MTTEPDRARLRVMTYNVKGLQLSRPDVVAVVRAAAPDVLGVQEPPRGPLGWCRTWKFAHDVGMRAVVNGRGARTTALLVARGRSVTGHAAVRLPNLSGRTGRGVAVATVDGIRFVVLHLSLVRDERAAHLSDLLVHHVPTTRTVVLGDLNEPPGGPAWTSLTSVLVDVDPMGDPTFSAIEPRLRIDAILRSPDLVSGTARVPSGQPAQVGSDHRPVVVDLQLLRAV
ncbi:endonuclease/exonuclease/phosphatase family protein [Cellulomonas humilata]|uniref:Endonuclease/exonuclease/phosphatase family metal-dependent hydrolase n=1 Tax=Cellulomonas humilata TaxID=144055 RepID=A0ABU0EJ22_9CELL|nr:endonuclease/exonuclease/phosphatase family protein [Cellulomonas humilata]MDQ0375197.1 endonuclease/exonuclease/phosphatase family metal-dependent hydrolase [Cellulomonas humilata]